jgi:hypothetical protein
MVCEARSMSGYDVIGDIHGHADKLIGLLRAMGYEQRSGAWRHAERTAVFVGDLIDRGPQQRESIGIPRAMVEAGSAHMVLGNHEFNAIAYAQWSEERGDYCRSRLGESGKKHIDQHAAFIDQIGLDTPGHRDAIAWFRTVPLWLDLDGLRVVHACWNDAEIGRLRPLVNEFGGVTDAVIIDGTTKGHPTYRAILGDPAMPSRLSNLEVPAHLVEFFAGAEMLVALRELADDLIQRVPPALTCTHVDVDSSCPTNGHQESHNNWATTRGSSHSRRFRAGSKDPTLGPSNKRSSLGRSAYRPIA